MKVILDIQDSKIAFVLELLNSLSFVKVSSISSKPTNNLKTAVSEVNQIKNGELEGISAQDLLNEL